MGNMQNSEYYDNAYLTRPSYDVHYTKSEYYELWVEVIKLVWQYDKDVPITELGCGTGQFAEVLFDEGYKNYCGYDFSKVAIKKAKARTKQLFFVENSLELIEWRAYKLLIALEFLEHTDDIKILKPRHDSEIIFTVPDFDDPAHVRHFKTEQEVRDRYTEYIDFESITKFGKYFICKGRIK